MEMSSLLFGGLDLMPYHVYVLQASRETWNPCLLHHGINVVVLFQVDRQPVSHYTEEDFAVDVQEADLAKLADVPRVLFLRD